jgi:hypothetical protein
MREVARKPRFTLPLLKAYVVHPLFHIVPELDRLLCSNTREETEDWSFGSSGYNVHRGACVRV